MSQNSQKQFRGVRSMKELSETVAVNNFRNKFESCRSFDLEDDMEFCPGLLTESDVSYLPLGNVDTNEFRDQAFFLARRVQHEADSPPKQLVSIHSSSSERSSLASNSPAHSPTQQPQQVASGFSLNSSSPPFIPPTYQNQHSGNLKLHQPAATRARNAIPIINPLTGITMASPPPSVSPGSRMHQTLGRRW